MLVLSSFSHFHSVQDPSPLDGSTHVQGGLLVSVKIIFFLLLFYVHWCLACMYVCVRVLDPLVLELQTVVSCHVDAGN